MKNIKKILLILFVVGFCSKLTFAQTTGTLTFTFTQVTHSPCYTGSKNVLAVWIQTSSGAFVKTKIRNVGSGTKDHLPTWAVNAGGTASNATAAACNVTDAVSGATNTSFTTKTFVWDGKDVNGSSNGTTVADGTYKVTIQETWNHGTSSTTTKSYTFTKGPTADHQTPADNADFTNVVLDWVPSNTTGISQNSFDINDFNVFPNPNDNGILNVTFSKANSLKIFNSLGEIVYEENINQITDGKKILDLTSFSNGIYFIAVSYEEKASRRKIILNK